MSPDLSVTHVPGPYHPESLHIRLLAQLQGSAFKPACRQAGLNTCTGGRLSASADPLGRKGTAWKLSRALFLGCILLCAQKNEPGFGAEPLYKRTGFPDQACLSADKSGNDRVLGCHAGPALIKKNWQRYEGRTHRCAPTKGLNAQLHQREPPLGIKIPLPDYKAGLRDHPFHP